MGRRKLYGEMMRQCGNDVKYFEVKEKKKKNVIKTDILKKNKFDLVWFQNPFYIKNNPIFIEYIRSKKIPIVIYNTYMPFIPYSECMDIWNKIDFLFVHSLEFHNFLQDSNLNSFYMPLGFYPEQYHKIKDRPIYDVMFCGTALSRDSSLEDKRAIYLRSLKKFNIVVYGKSFSGKVGNIGVRDYWTNFQQCRLYPKSRINLDLPFFHQEPKFYRDKYHIKNRFFEIPATGNFLLTVRCPEFLENFDEDTIGYYDDNIDSLKESVKRYLKDKRLRQKMAKKACKLVYQKHTYLHRFKKMFKIIKS